MRQSTSPLAPKPGSAMTSLSSPKTARAPRGEIDWEHETYLEADESAYIHDTGDSRLPSRAQSRRGTRVRAGRSGQQRRYATVEECPLPTVPSDPDQQLTLPCNVQISHSLRIPVEEFDIRFEAPRAKAAWRQWALSPLCQKLFLDAFWWVLIEEFKKQASDGRALQDFIFGRLAHKYTKLLLPDESKGGAPNDGYLEIFALVMAQGLLRAFQVAFPKSKHKFSEAFYRRILRHVTQWTVSTPRTSGNLRDVSHHESSLVGRMVDPSEVRQDFSYDASMSAKAIEQWRASFLPPAHDPYNKNRHSLLVNHFLEARGISEQPFDKHAFDAYGVKKKPLRECRFPEKENDGEGRFKNLAHVQKQSKKVNGLASISPPVEHLLADVPAHLKTAVSALLAAGLGAQEAVALAGFMHSGSDELEEADGPGSIETDAREHIEAPGVSYVSVAAGSFERTRQALERYKDVRRKGMSSVYLSHRETAHLLQELRHLWGHVGRRDARYISNSLAHWDPKPIITELSRETREKATQEAHKEVAGALARSSRVRDEAEGFLRANGRGFSWTRTSYGQYRARFQKGEAEEVLTA